jgi:hypothetical protein
MHLIEMIQAREQEQINRPFAQHLVDDVHVARLGVAGPWAL